MSLLLQILSFLRHAGAKHGLRRAEGCEEQMGMLFDEIREWRQMNGEEAVMPGMCIVGVDEESEGDE